MRTPPYLPFASLFDISILVTILRLLQPLTVHHTVVILPSFPSALQLRLSFGLLNGQPPLGSHDEVLDSLQYPLHMLNLGDTKFLRVTTSESQEFASTYVVTCKAFCILTTGVFPAMLPPQLHHTVAIRDQISGLWSPSRISKSDFDCK
jgi:hypothetical protein